MTFDLRMAILASLSPVVESDPRVLTGWADNLDLVADAYAERGHLELTAVKRERAAHLRDLARVGLR